MSALCVSVGHAGGAGSERPAPTSNREAEVVTVVPERRGAAETADASGSHTLLGRSLCLPELSGVVLECAGKVRRALVGKGGQCVLTGKCWWCCQGHMEIVLTLIPHLDCSLQHMADPLLQATVGCEEVRKWVLGERLRFTEIKTMRLALTSVHDVPGLPDVIFNSDAGDAEMQSRQSVCRRCAACCHVCCMRQWCTAATPVTLPSCCCPPVMCVVQGGRLV